MTPEELSTILDKLLKTEHLKLTTSTINHVKKMSRGPLPFSKLYL